MVILVTVPPVVLTVKVAVLPTHNFCRDSVRVHVWAIKVLHASNKIMVLNNLIMLIYGNINQFYERIDARRKC